jgi:hypothetical protein
MLTASCWRELPPANELAVHPGAQLNTQGLNRTRSDSAKHAGTRPNMQALGRTLRDSAEHAGTRPIISGIGQLFRALGPEFTRCIALVQPS